MEQGRSYLAPFTPRGLAVDGVAGLVVTLVIGAPTAVVPNPFFTRMTPTRPQDYVFLALTALLTGIIAATYLAPLPRTAPAAGAEERRLTVGGLLSFLAVGCPVCNKLVVLALGFGGAMRWFAPVQPLLGVASLVLLGASAWARLRAVRAGCPSCVPVPVPRHPSAGV